MSRFGWRLSVVIIAVLLAGGLTFAQVAPGKKAPNFTLKTLSGQDFELKPLVSKGKDRKAVVMLAFWAPWCGPCRGEAPRLQKLHEKYESKGVAIIGIAVQESKKRVQRFVDENKLRYTILLDVDGSKAGAKYGAPPIPRAYILDSDGVVRRTHLGYAPGSERELEKDIQDILAEKSR